MRERKGKGEEGGPSVEMRWRSGCYSLMYCRKKEGGEKEKERRRDKIV